MESETKINYDYVNQSLLTVENVKNILLTISPELFKLSYVTFDYPDVEEILNHKYSIINIKQFFKLKNEVNLNNDLEDDSIGHFILIINSSFDKTKNEENDLNNDSQQNSTCIVYPLYYINCFNLENYLKNDCDFKNVVWNYNIIQHGNSSSCGWLCCKIAYDYFVKNNIEVECRDYKLIDV